MQYHIDIKSKNSIFYTLILVPKPHTLNAGYRGSVNVVWILWSSFMPLEML